MSKVKVELKGLAGFQRANHMTEDFKTFAYANLWHLHISMKLSYNSWVLCS